MINYRVGNLIILFLATIGFALCLHSLYIFFADLLYWIRKPRGVLSRAAWMASRAEARAKPSGYMELEFPWGISYVITGIFTFLIYLALEGSTVQSGAFLILLLPILLRYWLGRQKSREASNEVRQFLIELRLQLSSGGTLRPALQAVAQYGPTNISRILRNHLAGQESGPQILRSVAEETRSRWLEDVASRAEAASEGMLNLDEAVAQSIARVTAEMETEIREELQKIPTRLVVIVAPMLLGPTLAAWVLPVVARIMASLEGNSFLGVF